MCVTLVMVIFGLIYTTLKYKRKSEKDLFTNSFNKNWYMENIIKWMQRAKKNGRRNEFAALFFDLDKFKEINDTKGHSVGDLILRKVVDTLENNVRSRDKIIRFGGDEFIILLRDINNEKQLKSKAEKILNELRINVKVTASIGGALFTNKNDVNYERFTQRIDVAVYAAKNNGRNCVVIV